MVATELPSETPLLAAQGVSKRYGRNLALKPTTFTIAAGECVAVIGENGAGKSTFAKVLTGIETSDGGGIVMVGKHVSFASPRDALQHGVALIPQELAYVPGLTVAENIMLNRLPGRRGFTSRARIEKAAASLMREFGMWVEPTATMSQLGVSEQQMVELVKALGRKSRLLILDEPTAALTEDEATNLYRALAELRHQGIGVVIISHHLDQISRHADRIDVFRDGQLVFSQSPATTTKAEFIQQMLGTDAVPQLARDSSRTIGRTIMSLDGWQAPGRPGLRDFSIELRHGEVLGVYGIRGSGSELLASGLGGRAPRLSGTVTLGGTSRSVFRSPRDAIACGIAYVPADRKRDGLVLGQSIRTSSAMLVLKKLARWGVIRTADESRVAHEYSTRFRLRYSSLAQPVGQLSGGNQQKVLLASRLAAEPAVLVVHEPTRGVDIGARHEIHETLRELTDSGTAVLVVTSDVEEAVDVSDRLLIIRDGEIVAELTGVDITQDNAVHHAAA
ncbi:sugar ABC transporter ATP-binding protein [Aeromicrobium sp. UC242_57]|uniref:sugar ABC transporter ATP-binding protein n=1 Tax=Aeromicrobium sp. UC242_57 TaxID=3374624 RepID=UPI00378BAA26